MAIGPVQMLVIGFRNPDFRGEIIRELDRLRQSDTARVIDALAVYKDAKGDIEVMHVSDIPPEEAVASGSTIADLVGLMIEGDHNQPKSGLPDNDKGAVMTEGAWDVIEEIPNNSAAALILIEHIWAVPLRDAIARAGGFRLADGIISPADLAEIGLVSSREADELVAMEASR